MYILPKLPYSFSALEPYIDSETMKIHYTKHHQGYVDKLNETLKGYPQLQKEKPEEIIKRLDSLPEKIKTPIRNYGGGVVNHNFFWSILKKNHGKIFPKIEKEIQKNFGSFQAFREEFINKAMSVFGSGWAWLIKEKEGLKISLKIITTQNQDSPLSLAKIPLLAVDVWEHAYYLKYQNRRLEYLEAFFEVINWEKVFFYLNS